MQASCTHVCVFSTWEPAYIVSLDVSLLFVCCCLGGLMDPPANSLLFVFYLGIWIYCQSGYVFVVHLLLLWGGLVHPAPNSLLLRSSWGNALG